MSEVDKATKKLRALDRYKRLEDKDTLSEYGQYLMGLDAERFNVAWAILKTRCSELPAIAEIAEAMRSVSRENRAPKVGCELCGGSGIVTMRESRALRKRFPYETDAEFKASCIQYDFGYRCICDNANKYSEHIPRFTDFYPGYRGGKS